MNNSHLQSLLGKNVLELSFVRRHPKLGWANIRSMLATTNYNLLNGQFGKQVLNFIPPKGVGMGYDYKSKGLSIAWDSMRQEYRLISPEQLEIRQQWDVSTPEGIDAFQKYFYDFIINMSEQDKLDFMGYIGVAVAPVPNVPQKPITVPKPKDQQQSPKSKEQKSIPGKIADRFRGFFNRVKNWFARKK